MTEQMKTSYRSIEADGHKQIVFRGLFYLQWILLPRKAAGVRTAD